MSNRLARIVDRARVLKERLEGVLEVGSSPIHVEMKSLSDRRHLVNLGITFGTTAALLVCVSIATVFLGAVLKANVAIPVASLFILAMAAFVAALVCFLREVFLAARSLVLV